MCAERVVRGGSAKPVRRWGRRRLGRRPRGGAGTRDGPRSRAHTKIAPEILPMVSMVR